MLTNSGWSQVNCTVPESPLLTLVSVDPLSGNVNLNWDLSPSSGIAGYVIYKFNDGVGIPVDTIWNPSASDYTHITPATRYFSVSYVVAAQRMPNCTSPLSNNLNTIFTEAKIDTCNKKITLSWNRYLSEPKKVISYKLSVSVNGGNFSDLAEVNPDSLKFTLIDFDTDSEYCFTVTAMLADGKISESNKVCLSTAMQRPPDWINADYATITDDKKVSVSFTIDPQSEVKSFILERKTGESGVWTETARMQSVNGVVAYTDNQADINLVNSYRLVALNYCNLRSTFSNTASNIVLKLEREMDNILLSWNKYRLWNGEVSDYKVYTDFGTGFLESRTVLQSDSTLKISYRDIMNDVTTGEICFYISATEMNNPYGISGVSNSLKACTSPTEVITVPNVFTPGNDLKNDLFKPVMSFIPKDYKLIITDRHGKVLFESDDFSESWDGSSGSLQQSQSVCLWFLRVTTPSGANLNRTGTVTIIRNR